MNTLFKCGCIVKITDVNLEATIYYCPLHKSAPRLYEALKNLLAVSRAGAFLSNRDIEQAEQALASIESK